MKSDYKSKFDNYLKDNSIRLDFDLYRAVLLTLNMMLENTFSKFDSIRINAKRFEVKQSDIRFYVDELKVKSRRYVKNQKQRKKEFAEIFHNNARFKEKLNEEEKIKHG